MSRPPESVAFVARHHWLMGGFIFCFVAGLYALTHNSHVLEFGRRSYVIALALGGLYLVTGALVWWGLPSGRAFNYACSIFYLVRPPLGFRILKISGSPEFKAHFARGKTKP
jgi:hypothetical protein